MTKTPISPEDILTGDLIAELRKAQGAAGSIPHGTMDHETQWLPFANLYNAAEALLDALEAATRVPVQGEPNDDREALRDEFRSYLGDEIYVCSRDHSAWGYGTMGLDDFSLAAEDDGIIESLVQIAKSRATVPDAATEVDYHEGLEEGIKIGRAERDAATEALLQTERRDVLRFEDRAVDAMAERDAALAAVERVRALHYETEGVHCHTVCAHRYCKDDSEDQHRWPCPTVAALDGAPEPEWEYVGVAFEHGGFMRIRNDQLVPEKFESWRKLMTKYPRVEILKRVKAVPAGPWLPVEGESKP